MSSSGGSKSIHKKQEHYQLLSGACLFRKVSYKVKLSSFSPKKKKKNTTFLWSHNEQLAAIRKAESKAQFEQSGGGGWHSTVCMELACPGITIQGCQARINVSKKKD